ncbi:uncharacterized protein LOC124356355 [Homalodisca vitripennis]|uniref:uncharacterized protein LOC124356355 n=1 Tax=Homalodisca vitripennis TaxID=197043 RepID=UPI001EEC94E6|nr:uncharacterized protein LOC124356355 [Homalodisca vitripennis]
MHFKVIVLCVFLSLVQYITAINKCNEDIIENILKMNGCPQSVLSKLHTFGDFKHVLVPETDMLDTLDYIHGCINEPIDGSSDATFTTGFSNKSLGPHTVNYHMEEHECGHVTDFHSSEYGGQTEIYFLSIGSTGCFYRCSIDGKEGTEAGGCIVPLNGQDDHDTLQEAINNCEEELAQVGMVEPFAHLFDLSP